MNKEFLTFCDELEQDIKSSYETGVSLEEAERLAGKFLHALYRISSEVQVADLDARMKKSGVKAVKAAVYMAEATKGDKKPSDVMLNALVDMNDMVQTEQQALDEAEVNNDKLSHYLSVFKEAHVYFRGVAKGRFEG